jgi:hypothetical protein
MKSIKTLVMGAIATVAFAAPPLAHAALVYDAAVHLPAQGFGNAPRDLTVHAAGSGCVGVSATGSITIGSGSCISDALVQDGNGITNLGGSEPSPHTDNQKYGVPTAASLGISTADQIGILFNATEPGGDSANVIDLTLKFYGVDGTLFGAINGQQYFPTTEPGNGVAGFVFVVSPDEFA